MPPVVWSKEEVEAVLTAGGIQIKGHLPDDVLRDIYDKIRVSRSYPPRLKRQIKDNFNRVGLTGLSDPPERHRPRY